MPSLAACRLRDGPHYSWIVTSSDSHPTDVHKLPSHKQLSSCLRQRRYDTSGQRPASARSYRPGDKEARYRFTSILLQKNNSTETQDSYAPCESAATKIIKINDEVLELIMVLEMFLDEYRMAYCNRWKYQEYTSTRPRSVLRHPITIGIFLCDITAGSRTEPLQWQPVLCFEA